ncbi:pyridoxamine 5'-phosphate oxidase family protein [Robertkochia sediminum]|uniref:pyridoxamine 5'-phosphate oxidase family protein n=1 Tax=Robertkochia sediminum TaxID=2785326 RepID=UPI0019325F4F|nr:pyridoxamine 5'-phosphate oxidase family protein [Robertkochia sediminum]MBL7473987.1 pyridoxamine 5'-phosphate oxidase family protein [Robertkochia sediminum]
MGKKFDKITPRLQAFIEKQKIFFTGTAMEDGRVNVSPKGMDALRVLGPNRVIWLNLTGSGNETAAHLLNKNRLTIMFCAFEGAPMILRLYGKAKVYHPEDAAYKEHIGLFPEIAGSRQLIDMEVDLLQTSCGMGVPLMAYEGDREELREWAEELGEEGVEAYWKKKNQFTIDGVATHIPLKD